jgi:hypothetical protein
MSFRLLVVALMCFGLVGYAEAQGPQLKLPDFTHLRGKATESVDISIGSFMFSLARRFMDDSDPESAAAKDLLKGIRSMRVRHYEFPHDNMYSQSDLDGVRSQLSSGGWNALAQVRDHRKDEDVDIYVSLENERITGFVIVASQPREFTIVNVVGTLDPEQIQAFRERFRYADTL